MSKKENLRGVLIMLLAVGLLSLMDVGLKLLVAHYPPLQVATLRGAASLPFAVVWVASTIGFPALLRVRWPLHLLRGALAVMMMVSFTYGLRSLPLATAYTLFFVAPLLITALSVPLLGERVGQARWIAIAIGLLGTIVVLRPGGEGLLSWPALAVLAAASGYAISAITVRVLGRTDSTQSMVFWLLLLLTVCAALLAAPDWVAIQPRHWWIIGMVGLFGALGQYAITEAFSRGEASIIAPFEYSGMAWVLMFDLLVWNVLPDRYTVIGAAIIVASGIYLVRRTRDEESFKP